MVKTIINPGLNLQRHATSTNCVQQKIVDELQIRSLKQDHDASNYHSRWAKARSLRNHMSDNLLHISKDWDIVEKYEVFSPIVILLLSQLFLNYTQFPWFTPDIERNNYSFCKRCFKKYMIPCHSHQISFSYQMKMDQCITGAIRANKPRVVKLPKPNVGMLFISPLPAEQ